jgi:hypothetical protein
MVPIIARCSTGCTWTGLDVCHCASCHQSFASVELFAQHRQPTRTRSLCKRPVVLGLVQTRGVWHLAPADRLARYRAIRAQTG